MGAKDLMIGDWVAVHRPGDRHEQVRVKSVIGNGTIEAKTSDGLVAIGELAVEPIPLTADILENNGFINYDFEHIAGQHKWSWWRDTGTLVSLWCRELNDDPRDGWMIRIESSDATCCFRVESVHELQHALRLCGIEKEIIL